MNSEKLDHPDCPFCDGADEDVDHLLQAALGYKGSTSTSSMAAPPLLGVRDAVESIARRLALQSVSGPGAHGRPWNHWVFDGIAVVTLLEEHTSSCGCAAPVGRLMSNLF